MYVSKLFENRIPELEEEQDLCSNQPVGPHSWHRSEHAHLLSD
jgi:hypothetical protein